MKQRIRNRGVWFVAGMLVRYERPRQVKGRRPKGGTTWLNFVLLQAPSAKAAHEKAMALGRKEARVNNGSHLWFGKWRFLGLAELIPVCGDIADGTELLWSDLGRVTRSRALSLVQPKAKLVRDAEKGRGTSPT